jgi:hypothetical protein
MSTALTRPCGFSAMRSGTKRSLRICSRADLNAVSFAGSIPAASTFSRYRRFFDRNDSVERAWIGIIVRSYSPQTLRSFASRAAGEPWT